MKKIIGFSVTALLVLTISLSAQTEEKAPQTGTRQHMGMAMRGNMIKKLNLTPEQDKQIKDIRYERQKKPIDLRSQIQKNRLELRHLISNNNIDEKKILNLTDENSKIQAELKKSAIQNWLAIYKILTPEQQEIWIKHFGQMRNGMRANIRNRIKERLDNRGPRMMQRFNGDRPMGMENFEESEPLGMITFDEQNLLDPTFSDNLTSLEPEIFDFNEPIGMQLFEDEFPLHEPMQDNENLPVFP